MPNIISGKIDASYCQTSTRDRPNRRRRHRNDETISNEIFWPKNHSGFNRFLFRHLEKVSKFESKIGEIISCWQWMIPWVGRSLGKVVSLMKKNHLTVIGRNLANELFWKIFYIRSKYRGNQQFVILNDTIG